MAERRSALAHLPADTGGDAPLRLAEERSAAVLQIQAWPETLATVEAVATQSLNAALPPLGHAAHFDGGKLLAIGPGRFLLATEDGNMGESFREALSSSDAAVTDISHGRTVLRLEGDAATELLTRCAPLDFDMIAFPPGGVVQTAIHHIDVVIHRLTDTSFEIWTLRSFATSLTEWLLDAGMELGVTFAHG